LTSHGGGSVDRGHHVDHDPGAARRNGSIIVEVQPDRIDVAVRFRMDSSHVTTVALVRVVPDSAGDHHVPVENRHVIHREIPSSSLYLSTGRRP
jgi:hypothetical protein|tara:strand:+ start:268 stop:549 length:282 start_codon:yes stop_codon:yes gene_type:complete